MEILRGRKKKCLGQFLNSLEKAASNPQKVKESFLLTQKNNSANQSIQTPNPTVKLFTAN